MGVPPQELPRGRVIASWTERLFPSRTNPGDATFIRSWKCNFCILLSSNIGSRRKFSNGRKFIRKSPTEKVSYFYRGARKENPTASQVSSNYSPIKKNKNLEAPVNTLRKKWRILRFNDNLFSQFNEFSLSSCTSKKLICFQSFSFFNSDEFSILLEFFPWVTEMEQKINSTSLTS